MEQVHAPALALQRQRIGVDIGRPEVVQRQQRGDAGLFALARQRAQAFGRRGQRVGVIGAGQAQRGHVDQQVGQQLEGGGAALLALPHERVGQARQRGGVAVQQHGESGVQLPLAIQRGRHRVEFHHRVQPQPGQRRAPVGGAMLRRVDEVQHWQQGRPQAARMSSSSRCLPSTGSRASMT